MNEMRQTVYPEPPRCPSRKYARTQTPIIWSMLALGCFLLLAWLLATLLSGGSGSGLWIVLPLLLPLVLVQFAFSVVAVVTGVRWVIHRKVEKRAPTSVGRTVSVFASLLIAVVLCGFWGIATAIVATSFAQSAYYGAEVGSNSSGLWVGVDPGSSEPRQYYGKIAVEIESLDYPNSTVEGYNVSNIFLYRGPRDADLLTDRLNPNAPVLLNTPYPGAYELKFSGQVIDAEGNLYFVSEEDRVLGAYLDKKNDCTLTLHLSMLPAKDVPVETYRSMLEDHDEDFNKGTEIVRLLTSLVEKGAQT